MDPLRRRLFDHATSAHEYSPADISASFLVNGRPPAEDASLALARHHFADYHLVVSGLVETPLHVSPTDLRAMPKQTQVTTHCCILTMVKYIRAIDFINDYYDIGEGQGGWREDHQYFSQEAGI